MSEHVHAINDADFEKDVLKASQPVLIDFWAGWCQPCKMISPIVDEIAKEYAGRIKVMKMNVDENVEIPAKYGIRGIPSLLLFKEGSVVGSKVGVLSKIQLSTFLNEHL